MELAELENDVLVALCHSLPARACPRRCRRVPRPPLPHVPRVAGCGLGASHRAGYSVLCDFELDLQGPPTACSRVCKHARHDAWLHACAPARVFFAQRRPVGPEAGGRTARALPRSLPSPPPPPSTPRSCIAPTLSPAPCLLLLPARRCCAQRCTKRQKSTSQRKRQRRSSCKQTSTTRWG